MVIKISSMDDVIITITTILKVTITGLKTMMMICGDCSVDDLVCALLPVSMHIRWSTGRFSHREGFNGWAECFGKVINRWEHSAWWSRFSRDVLGSAVSCLLLFTETMHLFICTNTLESGSCFEAG